MFMKKKENNEEVQKLIFLIFLKKGKVELVKN
jgi:hypothetical protein